MSEPKKVWRVYFLSGGDNTNQFGFCYQRGIIGIGWQIGRKPRDREDYRKLMKCVYGGTNLRGWDLASKAIADEMDKGHLVWARNHASDGDGDGRIYLGKISGGWKYRDDAEYRNADIVSIRPCRLHEVRAADVGENAAGFLRKTIADRFRLGCTVQPITNERFKQRTEEIWKKIQKDKKAR